MRTIGEVEYELKNLKDKLMMLSQTRTTSDYEVKGLDVYTHHEKTTVGSKSEIQRIKERIDQLEKELESIEKGKEHNKEYIKGVKETKAKADEAAAERAQAEAAINEREVKKDFKKLKKAYKNIGLWNRITNKLQGKKPNWKKIKQDLTREEMEFLLKVSSGNTQERHNDFEQAKARNEERPRKERKTFKELRKRQRQNNLEQMRKLLVSRERLKQEMEMENGKYGRRY